MPSQAAAAKEAGTKVSSEPKTLQPPPLRSHKARQGALLEVGAGMHEQDNTRRAPINPTSAQVIAARPTRNGERPDELANAAVASVPT